MKGSKILFCSSKFPRARESISSKSTDNSGTPSKRFASPDLDTCHMFGRKVTLSTVWCLSGFRTEDRQFRTSVPTHCLTSSLAWQADSHSTTQPKKKKKSLHLYGRKIHNRVNNSLALEPIMKPVRIPTPYFNIIPPERPVDTNDIFPKSFLTNASHSPPFGHYRVRTADRSSDYSSIQLIPFFRVQIFCTTPSLKHITMVS